MPTLVVRNVPEQLHSRLKERALLNQRSVTGEVVQLIEPGLGTTPARPPLPPPVRLRSGRTVDIDEFEAAVADGQQ